MNVFLRQIKTIFLLLAVFCLSSCGGGGGAPAPDVHEIVVNGATNFRDFGGYPIYGGRNIAWGVLYRSSKITSLTDTGRQQFQALGIEHVIDLRSLQEVESEPDQLPSGVVYDNIPIIDAVMNNLFVALETGDTTSMLFRNVVEIHSSVYIDNLEEFRAIMAIVMDDDSRPILVHCSSGSIRTGFTVALIQAILNVTESSIYDDFLLTNEVIASEISEELNEFREQFIANTGQEPTEQDMTNISNAVIVHSEYLDAALNRVREEYGSVDNFIRTGLGITDQARYQFQSALTESL